VPGYDIVLINVVSASTISFQGAAAQLLISTKFNLSRFRKAKRDSLTRSVTPSVGVYSIDRPAVSSVHIFALCLSLVLLPTRCRVGHNRLSRMAQLDPNRTIPWPLESRAGSRPSPSVTATMTRFLGVRQGRLNTQRVRAGSRSEVRRATVSRGPNGPTCAGLDRNIPALASTGPQ
jgi:hypothetical protein